MRLQKVIGLLALNFVLGASMLSADQFDQEERAVIDAALHYPFLLWQCEERLRLTDRTYLSDFVPTILQDGSGSDRRDSKFPITQEIVDSLRARNLQSIPLSDVKAPPCQTHTREERRNYRFMKRAHVSRPGFSADGTKAIVVIQNATNGGGNILFMEKTQGTWSVVARGAWEV